MNKSATSKLPDKSKFANTFRILSRISYWIHILLGSISGVTLLLVFFSRSATNNGTGVGIFIAIFSLIALGFSVYWAYRYRQLAKQLQQVNPDTQPSRTEIIRFLRIGLLASLVGLLLAFIASEISLVTLVAAAISRPRLLYLLLAPHCHLLEVQAVLQNDQLLKLVVRQNIVHRQGRKPSLIELLQLHL
jgi:Protein of unknown function (DUF3611)